MSFASAYVERESLGQNQYRDTISLRPVAYLDSILRAINSNWQQGDGTWPHVVTAAPMLVYTASDGMRRICPTRDPARYLEIGAPYVMQAGTWQKVVFGAATRAGNRITWSRTQADLSVTMAGHFVKMDIALKGGYVPPNGQFAFPVGLNGLARQGGNILADGVPVCRLRPPMVYDAANPLDVRQIAWDFVSVGGQTYLLFTLPSLAGMTAPVVDPTTETIQPDGTAGKAAWIRKDEPTSNDGSGGSILVNQGGVYVFKALVQFPLDSIPGGASDLSGMFSLWKNYQYNTHLAASTAVHAITAAWTEGEVTWNQRVSGVNWGTAGVDYEVSAQDTQTVPSTTGQFTNWNVTDALQRWYAGTLANNGLITRCASEMAFYNGFDSDDSTTPGQRPKLTVVYTEAASTPIPVFLHHYRQQGMM